jgi:hypothetical protein
MGSSGGVITVPDMETCLQLRRYAPIFKLKRKYNLFTLAGPPHRMPARRPISTFTSAAYARRRFLFWRAFSHKTGFHFCECALSCAAHPQNAPLAELVDARDSKSRSFGSAGSIPAGGTIARAPVSAALILKFVTRRVLFFLHDLTFLHGASTPKPHHPAPPP